VPHGVIWVPIRRKAVRASSCVDAVGDTHFRRLAERLIDDAVSLGEAEQGGELFFRRICRELEEKPDALNPDGGVFRDAERASEIQVAFRTDRTVTNLNTDRGGDGSQGNSGTACERLQQHVAGTSGEPVASCGWMKTCFNESFSRSDLAGNSRPDSSLSFEGHERGFRVFAIVLLERGLDRSEFFCLHTHLES